MISRISDFFFQIVFLLQLYYNIRGLSDVFLTSGFAFWPFAFTDKSFDIHVYLFFSEEYFLLLTFLYKPVLSFQFVKTCPDSTWMWNIRQTFFLKWAKSAMIFLKGGLHLVRLSGSLRVTHFCLLCLELLLSRLLLLQFLAAPPAFAINLDHVVPTGVLCLYT